MFLPPLLKSCLPLWAVKIIPNSGELTTGNEHFKVRLIKAQETPPKDYTNEEIKLLIKKPDKKARFLEWRSWAMACFALGTGARIGTMAEIQIKDKDLKNAKLFYRHTKSKRE